MKVLNKCISLLLVVVLTVTVFTVNTFAANDVKENSKETASEETLKVESEIVEKRDEFTKVYQLEDGSFYEITSVKPLHILENDEWVDAKKVSVPNTVKDVAKQCKQLTAAAQSVNRQENNRGAAMHQYNQSNTDLTVTFLNADDDEIIDQNSIMLLKINSFPTNNNSLVTISERIMLDINVEIEDTGSMYVYENSSSMDNATYSDFNSFYYLSSSAYDDKLLDTVEIVDSSLYAFYITKAYSGWEKGFTPNYGVAFMTDDDYTAYYYEVFATRRYKECTAFNTESTYSTFNMNDAGTGYIDDYNNSLVLKRDELGMVNSNLPVNIKIIYEQNKNNNDSSQNVVGNAAYVNYDSRLTTFSIGNDSGFQWNTLEGKTLRFVSNGSPNTYPEMYNDGYSFTIPSDSTQKRYIQDSSGYKYIFNSDGSIDSIQNSSNVTVAQIHYVDGVNRIHYIEDNNNIRFYFTYQDKSYSFSGNSFNYTILKSIAAKEYDPDLEELHNIKVDSTHNAIMNYAYTAVANGKVSLSTVTYPYSTPNTVEYSYVSGNLSSMINNINGKRLTFSYDEITEYSLSGSAPYVISPTNNNTVNRRNAVAGYTIETLVNSTYQFESSLTINSSNAYQRKLYYSSGAEKLIQYDEQLRVTLLKDSNTIHMYSYSNGVRSEETYNISNTSVNQLPIHATSSSAWEGFYDFSSSEVNTVSLNYNHFTSNVLYLSDIYDEEVFVESAVTPGQNDTKMIVGGDFFSNATSGHNDIGILVYYLDEDLEPVPVEYVKIDSSIYLEKQFCYKTIDLPTLPDGEDSFIVRVYSNESNAKVFADNFFCFFK
ncbi:MAG: hypothetical protein IJI67_05995 [Clostridia bacterium]|nr:hypothetical protein [Clostridia bacterium]